MVDIVRRRNPKFHGFAFKMFHILHDMIPGEMPFEEFRRLLTVKAGYYQTVGHVDGSVMIVPDSLKFDAMGDDEFKTCWLAMLQAFITKYGNEITYEQLTEAALM